MHLHNVKSFGSMDRHQHQRNQAPKDLICLKQQWVPTFVVSLSDVENNIVDPTKQSMVMTMSFIRKQMDMGYMTTCNRSHNNLLTMLNLWFIMRYNKLEIWRIPRSKNSISSSVQEFPV